MNIQTNFDQSSNCMIISVETNLLQKYFKNLAGMFSATKDKPSGLTISQKDGNTAIVSFPIPEGRIKVEMQRAMVAIDKNDLNNIMDVINKFANAAIRKELMNTEFIPLEGYSTDNLKVDIKAAIKAGRKFCIIDTYDSYLTQTKSREYKYNQYMVDKDTDEYSDVAILIETGKFKELKKEYKPKLKYTEWV